MQIKPELLVGTMAFKKMNNGDYTASINNDVVRDAIDAVVKAVTLSDELPISPYVTLSMREKLFEYILVTRFMVDHSDVMKKLKDDTLNISVKLDDVPYVITIANKSDDLGGVIYTMKPL